MERVPVGEFFIGPGEPLAVVSGPCVIESQDHTLYCAEALCKMTSRRGLNFIFKASYDKANRSSGSSFRGVGLESGLRILQRVREEFGCPVVTDVHTPGEAAAAGEVCDVVQLPAFLCRQTDLVIACGETGRPVLAKKGQFLAPWDMKTVVEKIVATGNKKIILVERGATFGYNNLVSDMRSIPIMQSLGYPVCFDATHSIQLPGGLGSKSGGQREYAPVLAKAAVAAGCNAVFLESHPQPEKALSDAASVMALDDVPALLDTLNALYHVVNDVVAAGR